MSLDLLTYSTWFPMPYVVQKGICQYLRSFVDTYLDIESSNSFQQVSLSKKIGPRLYIVMWSVTLRIDNLDCRVGTITIDCYSYAHSIHMWEVPHTIYM